MGSLAGGAAAFVFVRRLLRPRRLWIVLPLLLFGAWQGGHGAFIHAKAILAQHLLRQAWARTQAGEAEARPWSWADTWPVARLRVERLGVDRIVLAGASGRTLAFAPGHVDGTPAPGAPGTSVIGGHRDTNFSFLRDLRPQDEIALETPDGAIRRYRVAGTRIVDHRRANIVLAGEASRLALVTCYPFDALRPGGPLRYVVEAEAATP